MDGAREVGDTLYDRDFAAWAEAQARALRDGAFDSVDWKNVIEEIEALGGSRRDTLESAIGLVLEHLLKLEHGLNDDPKRGWTLSVGTHRRLARKILKKNPSLKPLVPSIIEEEYEDARAAALESFRVYEKAIYPHYLEAIPETCPYTEADVLG